MSELKPCPFCGEEILWNVYPDGEIQGHCTTKGCQLFFTDFIGMELSVWNSRPIEDALRAENERLRQALEVYADENAWVAITYQDRLYPAFLPHNNPTVIAREALDVKDGE